MILNRRQLLLAMGASAISGPLKAGNTDIVLRPGKVSAPIDGQSIDLLGFNNSVPGPEIRLRQNDVLTVRLENTLDEGIILHWHGIRLPNAMDGVNVLTQDAVVPGAKFDYRFKVPDAGTFWYHSHYLSLEQVSRGLFGPLIVEEPTPPDIDQDITIQLFDILRDAAGSFDREFYADHYVTDGRIGDYRMAFSSSEQARVGDRIRLRFINPSVDRKYKVQVQGMSGMIVSFDGMPVPYPLPLTELTLAPGQRVDVIGDVEAEVVILEQSEPEPTILATISTFGSRERRETEVKALPDNRLPRPGKITHHTDLVMQGGAGGSPHGGFGTWAFNDTSGLPRVPLVSARRGDTALIQLRNETAFPHGIHLHGHHFWETDINENPTVLRDTTLVDPGDARKILLVLDNPGAWLFHCHMLSHQEDGMATWIQVA